MTQHSVVSGHEVVDLTFSPASGETSTRRNWNFRDTAVSEPKPEIRAALVGFDYEEGWYTDLEYESTIPLPFAQELLDEAYDKAESWEDSVNCRPETRRLHGHRAGLPFAARGLGEAAGVYADGLDSQRLRTAYPFHDLDGYDRHVAERRFRPGSAEILSVSGAAEPERGAQPLQRRHRRRVFEQIFGGTRAASTPATHFMSCSTCATRSTSPYTITSRARSARTA